MHLKRIGWVLLFLMSLCASAFADVAGTLEDYLYCPNEGALTSGRVCVKCLGTDVKDYENTTSLPTCKKASEFEADDYEKVCQSETYLEVWGEIWCKVLDTDNDTETSGKDSEVGVDSETEKDSGQATDDSDLGTTDETDVVPPEKKESSSGCSAADVGSSVPARPFVTFLRLLLGW